ncbi:NADH dehydrogenase [ubiquinone] 1 alpha subcomplex assembly factor 5 [Mytilus galloprovincialis]|uniref:Arginine-hydroxylase NDUFAF5, mitochondrial n=2 Tax=Mytilus galloprovincialis TaxID=29158 RepID=A0A8B6C1P0_MYTGA|nr:NADH dehydrogenase [ubiquinone] 1 alpha subcomplex assembly factor 5 [Mytilus galloprovincialis]
MVLTVSSGCSWCHLTWLYRNCAKTIKNSHFMMRRCFATKKPETVMNVFDRNAKKLQKERTTILKDYKVYDYVKEEIGYRTFDRICDIKREFDVLVDLGCGRGYVSKHLQKEMVKTVYQCEITELLLKQCEKPEDVITHHMVVDEEFIPFKENSIDMFVSSLSLHWVNDLPGCFRQVQKSLKNDGAFIGCMFGGDTLFELRVSLQLAETELEGGFAPHISPFTDVRDLGSLLNNSDFTLLTIDVDEMTVIYPGIKELMHDLKGMGENNCAWSRKPMLHRNTIELANEKYKEMFGKEGGIPATFQIINFIGWKPDPSQAKPAKRGSGQVSFADLHKINEPTKDKDISNDEDKHSK